MLGMRVYHNTRDEAFRTPYGALALGSAIGLAVDVAESPGAEVQLRTWIDGVGEGLYRMEPDSAGGAAGFVRYRATIVPEAAGIVWYQFVITDTDGFVWRYGARNGCAGGEGQLVGWEPPSFRLLVYDPGEEAPFWHIPIEPVLQDEVARRNMDEIVATLLENYPVELCRTAMPWDAGAAAESPAPELLDMAGALEDAKANGACAWFADAKDVFGFWRQDESGALTCALFNASPHDARDVLVPMAGEGVSELVTGHAVPVVEASGAAGGAEPAAGRYARVSLWPFGSAILHFHKRERLAKPMDAGLGVLVHVTSLPMEDARPGTLGAPARAFVDWLADAGVRYWQVLPLNPTDEYGSPYAGISAFAGNALLTEGADGTAGAAAESAPEEYRAFCEREAHWLDPYAAFMAIRADAGRGKPWQEWPEQLRRYEPDAIARDASLAQSAEAFRRRQFAFDRQWRDVRAYANAKGIQIIGDMPIYVSADSADVWAFPELFQLGDDGMPQLVAGCPPDAFAVDGQIWGNPVYDWGKLHAEGYAWWLQRLQRAFDLYDYVRLDHFIGFSRYFSIPVGAKATSGSYRLGPGFDFFRAAHERFGQLPVIAEDLGLLTPRVRALVAECGFPGMDVVQFADGSDPLASYNPRPEKVVYTGTHDNQTLLGYVRDRYPDEDERQAFEALVGAVVACGAPVSILPLQDLMGLGDEARMNVPGVAEGNWAWQADAADFAAAEELLRAISK